VQDFIKQIKAVDFDPTRTIQHNIIAQV